MSCRKWRLRSEWTAFIPELWEPDWQGTRIGSSQVNILLFTLLPLFNSDSEAGWFWFRPIRSVLLPFVQDGEVYPASCSNNMLRSNKPSSERCIRQILRRLQRGVYVEARRRRHRGVQTMDRVGSNGRWDMVVGKIFNTTILEQYRNERTYT